ncbi:conserved Plasmodium protein, unknown function [Plasmodium gallinaceum]|uniref:PIH1 domain-containing protein n=1 Tax=Plasmodium gallinaceum TaxID=5849 RepID=A0A1J1GS82_PLAGA|nr:conserved Plasmodium protein, unknown function [Plasmodium gallinaceum]CRG94168.1 conserved Plasmodium protein, unknown function [Plasmodium gallinaceum]
MDLKNAECIWDALNDLCKNDRKAYDKFIKKHMDKIHKAKPVKPKFCFCVVADVEQVAIKTNINEYKEKICDYYIYIYYTNKIRAPILPKDFMNNIDSINFENIFISTSKIKGESSKDMYAEAVIHSIIYKNMNNLYFKNKIVTRILEIMNDYEKTFRNDIIVNTNTFKYIELQYVPKSCHYLNPHCIDNNSIEKNDETIDEEDIKFYNILNEKQNQNNDPINEEKKEIKIHSTSSDILNDIKLVKTTKKNNDNESTKVNIPKQIRSYHYTIIDRFLHIILTFNNISYDDIEILKKNNNIDIYVSNQSNECMSLNFKENLSDNVKAYFNEKLLKLTISIELLY